MKKILFLLSVAALLLPLDSSAQSKPKIKSVDFTIQVPTPGMSLFDAREMQFTSAKTEFGDLAATGGIQVQEIDWIGDFREDDEGDMFFKDGFIYKARIKFMVDPSGKYDTDYIFKDNDYYIDGSASAPQSTECRPRSSAALLTSSTLRYPCLLEPVEKARCVIWHRAAQRTMSSTRTHTAHRRKRIQSPRPMLLARM